MKAVVGVQIKTVEYVWNNRADPDVLGAGVQYGTGSKSIYLPENSIVFRHVFVVLHVQTGADVAGNVSDIDVLLEMGGIDRSPDYDPVTGQYTTNSGESVMVWIIAEFTSAFSSYWTNGQAVIFKVTVSGASTQGHACKIYITYEYDDASPTQIRTLKYFVGSDNTELPADSTLVYTHTIGIPETGIVIRDKWYEISGDVQAGVGGESHYFQIRIGTDTYTPPSFLEGALKDNMQHVYIQEPTVSWAYNTSQELSIYSGNTACCVISAIGCVTYEYASDSPTQRKTVAYNLGYFDLNGSIYPQSVSTYVYLPDLVTPSTDVKSAWFEFIGVAVKDTAMYIEASIDVVSEPVGRLYTTSVSGEVIENYMLRHDITDFFRTEFEEGKLVICRFGDDKGYSYAIGVILYVTYDYNKDASTQIKTVCYPFGQLPDGLSGDIRTTPYITLYFPESNKTKRSVSFQAYMISSATESSKYETAIVDGAVFGSRVGVMSGSTGEVLTLQVSNKDHENKIVFTDPTYRPWFRIVTGVEFLNYSACAILSLTYEFTLIVETIVAKDFPMSYLEEPAMAKELISKVSGATITHVAKEFPERLLKAQKAQELRSKWT